MASEEGAASQLFMQSHEPSSTGKMGSTLSNLSERSKPLVPLMRVATGVGAIGAGLAALVAVTFQISNHITEAFDSLREDFKVANKVLREELKADNKALRDELKTEIKVLKDELKADIESVRRDLNKETKELRVDIKNLDEKFNLLNSEFVRDRERYLRTSSQKGQPNLPIGDNNRNAISTLEQLLGHEDWTLLRKLLNREKALHANIVGK